MKHSTPAPVHPHLELHQSRASSVIVHHVPKSAVKDFMDWQDGVTTVTETFPGYQTTEVYPPANDQQQDWVVVIHFNDSKSLQAWLDSPKRTECIAKLPKSMQDFRLKIIPSGLDFWFPGTSDKGNRPPHWKVFLTVLLGLYPTVMVLALVLLPHTQGFGLPIAALIGNIVSVAFLEWLGAPMINRVVGPWLHANDETDKRFTLIGAGLIVAALGLMLFLFYLITHQIQ